MRAPWGAQVHLDGGSHPLEGLDGESLRAPFAGVVVNAGVHALRIVLGGDEEDVTLRHVTMKAGQRYALVLTGATLSMASLDEQQTLALSEGTPLLDEPWRRAPHRRTKLLLVVVLAGMSLGSLVMLWGRAVALLLRTERNKAFGSWLLASLLWVWVGGGAAYCRLAAAVPGGRVVVAGVAAALGLATLGLGLRGSLRAHRVFVSLAQAGAAWAVVTYVLVGGLAVGGLLLVQSAVLLVAGSAGNMQANSRGYAAALAAFTLSPLAGALVPGGTSGRGALPGMTGMTAEVVGTVPLGLLGVALFGSWIYARHQGFRDSVAGGSP
jgi:hypothetical protein